MDYWPFFLTVLLFCSVLLLVYLDVDILYYSFAVYYYSELKGKLKKLYKKLNNYVKDLMFHFYNQLSSLFNLGTVLGDGPSHLSKFKILYLTIGKFGKKTSLCCHFILHSNFFWTTFYTRQYLPLQYFTQLTASCPSITVEVK